MTLPHEKANAINMTHDFLLSLYEKKNHPKNMSEWRNAVRRCLKHYPSRWDVSRLAKASPDILQYDVDELRDVEK